MSPQFGILVDLAAFHGWHIVFLLLILAIIRPILLLYTFLGFTWALFQGRVVRIVLAIGLGLPAILGALPVLVTLFAGLSIGLLLLIVALEVFIGFLLGVLLSVPFSALKYAATISDQFRGESDSGLQDPSGGPITSTGLLYMIIALLAFANADGLNYTFSLLYESYVIWPIASPFPSIEWATLGRLLTLITDSMWLAIRVCMPVFAVLFLIEVALIVAARIAKRYSLYNMAFTVKNVSAILVLPPVAIYIYLLSGDILFDGITLPELWGLSNR